ncbi:MAG TPA: TonB family protein [Flavisolibacter sp.]|jgi:TonB family protein|nr:TonB family protein [Flavisolibacter sp.]
MKPIFFLSLIVLPLLGLSQKKDTVLRYLDAKLELTTQKEAVYLGVSVKQNDHWYLLVLYADTTPVLKAWYKDKNLTIKDGPYTVFYPGNRLAQKSYYKEGLLNGGFMTWYENGQRKDSGELRNNQMIGIWNKWFDNGQQMIQAVYTAASLPPAVNDINGMVASAYTGIKDGYYTSWYRNGNREATGRFKQDQMEGEWLWFYENTQPSTQELYEGGKVVKLQCFDSTGKETGDYCSLSRPAVLKYYGDYKEFIFQNLQWPEEALKNNIEGTVNVKFKIDRLGQLQNLQLEGGHEILKKSVRELFDAMKEWYPAISHNRLMESEEEITIPFYRHKE